MAFAAYAFFWNLGQKPLAEWDESRYGQIALEMLRNGDWVNYYYNGLPEFWTAKPPLSIWSIVFSYKVFGFNEFALRLPATLAGIAALFFLYRIFMLYLAETFVWIGLFLVLTTKALVGSHIARSGDTDSFLLAGLLAFLFYFARFFQRNKNSDLLLAGLALGLAFFAKGFAIGFYFPVGLFFLAYRSGWRKLFWNRFFYMGGSIFLLFPICWFLTVLYFGNKDQTGQFGGANAIEVMFLFDLVGRFNGSIDSGRNGIDLGFLPRAMEIRFGIWWLVLCFWWIFAFFSKLGDLKDSHTPILVFKSHDRRREAVLLSFVGMFSILFLLFVSVVKLDWYLAPILPFFCFLFFHGFDIAYRRKKAVALILTILCCLLGLANQIQYVSLDESNSNLRDFVYENHMALSQAQRVYSSRNLKQDELLYVSWVHKNPIHTKEKYSEIQNLSCEDGTCFLDLP